MIAFLNLHKEIKSVYIFEKSSKYINKEENSWRKSIFF